jgi:uncharacterized membrane protein YhhN
VVSHSHTSVTTRLAGPAILGMIAITAYEIDASAWIAITARIACGAWLAINAFEGARHIHAISTPRHPTDQSPSRFARAGLWIATGVLFAGIADGVLALSSGSVRLFVAAMGLFAVGHLALIKGLWPLPQVGRARWVSTLLLLVAYAAAVLVVLWPSLGALRGPVIAYVAILTMMCWRACLVAQSPGEGVPRMAYAIGGVLFVFADTLLALHKFRAPLPHHRLLALAPYWVSLGAFVYAIASQPREAAVQPRVLRE